MARGNSLWIIAVIWLILAGAAANGAPQYDIHVLGLTDADHSHSVSGYHNSVPAAVNAAGQVTGTSVRYTAHGGKSAWFFDLSSGTTTRIGLTDAAHTTGSGGHISEVFGLSGNGYVAGTSQRYSPTLPAGRSAWSYHHATDATTRTGFFDSAFHTRSNGDQESVVNTINSIGQVLGRSTRYNGTEFIYGSSSWIYDPATGTTTRIGLFGDAQHTATNGSASSTAFATRTSPLNNTGHAIGISDRYSGANERGWSAWIHERSTNFNIPIGLIDAAHTSVNGTRLNRPIGLNDAGQVIGAAWRGGDGINGDSAWYYNRASNTTVLVGLVDAEHTSIGGKKNSEPVFIGAGGHALGRSSRYSGSTNMGQSAWTYHPSSGTTTRIGLTGANYTRSDGYEFSEPVTANAGGAAVGYSARYSGSTALGYATWLRNASGAATTRVGLTDSRHTGAAGEQDSRPLFINPLGQVVGTATRYANSGGTVGQSGWFYDPVSNSTSSLVFSVGTADFASTTPRFLGDDGIVVGEYSLRSGGANLGDRAFYWTQAQGFFDLGDLVAGGPSFSDWSHLDGIIDQHGVQYIVGLAKIGSPSVPSEMAYLLSPPIPEPAGVTWMFVTAWAIALGKRRPHGPR